MCVLYRARTWRRPDSHVLCVPRRGFPRFAIPESRRPSYLRQETRLRDGEPPLSAEGKNNRLVARFRSSGESLATIIYYLTTLVLRKNPSRIGAITKFHPLARDDGSPKFAISSASIMSSYTASFQLFTTNIVYPFNFRVVK